MRWVAAWCSAQSDVNPRSGQKPLQENVITGWKSVGPIQPEREICKEDARKGLLESMINKTAIIQDKKIYLCQIFHFGILSQFLLLYNQLMVILWAKPSTCSTILTKVGANCSVAWLRMKYWPMAADYEANFHSENCKLCQYFIDVAQKG